MKIVITAATTFEWMPAYLAINPLYKSGDEKMNILFHQSGVGMLATSVALMKLIAHEKPNLIIQIGIAGCFHTTENLSKVVLVKEEFIGDMGVEEDNEWKDIFDLGLEGNDHPPYQNKGLTNPWLNQYNLLNLPTVTGVTVNTISTESKKIEQLQRKYQAQIESMEGAALHYICRDANLPFLQIRATSNYVGERNKSKWTIKESIDNLNTTVLKFIDALYHIS